MKIIDDMKKRRKRRIRLTQQRRIAIYGVFVIKNPTRQVWVKGRDGRLHKRTIGFTIEKGRGRFEFYGNSRDLYKAIRLAHNFIPIKQFTIISAHDFVENPAKYAVRGRWIAKQITS